MNNELKIKLLNNSKHYSLDRFTLIYALKKGYFNLAQHLISLGFDPNLADDSDTLKRTPLIYCTFIRDERWALTIAQNLLEHNAYLSKGDSRNMTPLHYCCAFGLEELLKLFLDSLDFDFSNSIDANGNNCMHHAVRSRNLNCINLIFAKCRQKEILCINIKNSYGLRPSDLEDEEKIGRIKQSRICPGHDSLEACKTAVIRFTNKFDYKDNDYDNDNLELKEKDKDQKMINITNKTKNQELWRNAVTKLRKTKFQENSKFYASNSKNEDNKNDYFLKTKFDEKLSNNFDNKTPDKMSKIKGKESDSRNSELSMSPNFAVSKSSNTKDFFIEKQTARLLTQKSFFIKFNDREKDIIEFNGLFMGKESLLETVKIKCPLVENSNQKNRTKLTRPKTPANQESKSFLNMDAQDLINDLNDASSEKFIEKSFINLNTEDSWRKEIPSVFARLENKLTPSYRDKVQPQIVLNKPKSAKSDLKNNKGRGSKLDVKRAISMTNVNLSSNQYFNEAETSSK